MPKIENWSRRESRESKSRPYWWIQDSTGTQVRVRRKTTEFRGPVVYEVNRIQGGSKRKRTLNTFDEKEEARKFAVNWLRNHPRG